MSERMKELQAVATRLRRDCDEAETCLLTERPTFAPPVVADIRAVCDAVTLMPCKHPRMFWVEPEPEIEERVNNVSRDMATDAGDSRMEGQPIREQIQRQQEPYCSICRTQQEAVAAAEDSKEVATQILANCAAHYSQPLVFSPTPQEVIDQAIGNAAKILDRHVAAKVAKRTAELQKELDDAHGIMRAVRGSVGAACMDRDAAVNELSALRTQVAELLTTEAALQKETPRPRSRTDQG